MLLIHFDPTKCAILGLIFDSVSHPSTAAVYHSCLLLTVAVKKYKPLPVDLIIYLPPTKALTET